MPVTLFLYHSTIKVLYPYCHVSVCNSSIWDLNRCNPIFKFVLWSLASNKLNTTVFPRLFGCNVLQHWYDILKDLPPWSPPIFMWISSFTVCFSTNKECLKKIVLAIITFENINKKILCESFLIGIRFCILLLYFLKCIFIFAWIFF